MTTCQELQQWTEAVAPQLAKDVADYYPSEAILHRYCRSILGANFLGWYDLDDDTQELLIAALAWKAAAELTARYNRIGEGWAESYHRGLKRMFEEGS